MSKLDWLTQEVDGLKEQYLYNHICTIMLCSTGRMSA
jgi:hypothetical protein